ncbi:hypothetical protein [Maribacter halichondriae]|uniref:hypothetical protein n=1 Tax=Maribacter halichondriae TaxID=2980554 RepID=UPI0030763284
MNVKISIHPFLYSLVLLGMLVLWSACRKDLEYAPSAGNLEFSKDTVFLDTIFTNLGSSTYALKVYNRTRDDIEIPSIRLAQGQNSDYRLNVDGVAGKEFHNIPVFSQDSLFIFIETTHDISTSGQNTFLYTDAIQFDSGDDQQEVQLVTLVKDAIFLYPKTLSDGTKETIVVGFDESGKEIRVEGFLMTDDQLNFTNEKPYVVYGYASVPSGKELQIAAGSRVHFHKDSGILIIEGASLKINGTLSTDQELLENEVIFEGDRLEPEFENIPGQWGTIWLSKGSIDNSIDHLTLKNATIGLLVEGDEAGPSPTLVLRNSQLYNSAAVNLWGRTASIVGENCVFGSAGNISLYCNSGGDYSFIHTTIANYWQNGFRSGAALEIDNASTEGNASDLTQAQFINCIIDGNKDVELTLRHNGSNAFSYSFSHCLLKFRDNSDSFENNPLYDFDNASLFQQLIVNEDVAFWDARNNDFRIDEASAAKSIANPDGALAVPLDILGMDRTASPDVGAFQAAPKN